jgi:hypothetical protein
MEAVNYSRNMFYDTGPSLLSIAVSKMKMKISKNLQKIKLVLLPSRQVMKLLNMRRILCVD